MQAVFQKLQPPAQDRASGKKEVTIRRIDTIGKKRETSKINCLGKEEPRTNENYKRQIQSKESPGRGGNEWSIYRQLGDNPLNLDSVKARFFQKTGLKEHLAAIQDKPVRPNYIDPTLSRPIEDIDQLIVESIQAFLIDNDLTLKKNDDYGLSYEIINKLHEIINKICGMQHQPRSLRFYLKEVLLNQLELELELAALEIEQKRSEQDEGVIVLRAQLHKKTEETKRLQLEKDKAIAMLSRKLSEVNEKYKDAEKNLAKLIDSRLLEKETSQKRHEAEMALEGIQKEKHTLENTLKQTMEQRESETNKLKDLEQQIKLMEGELEKSEQEKKQLEQTAIKFKTERKILAREKMKIEEQLQQLNKALTTVQEDNKKLLQKAAASTSEIERETNPNATLIAIDLNNISISYMQSSGLRFTPEELFTKTLSLPEKDSILIGHVFCTPNLKHHQSSIKNPLASSFTWHETSFMKGFIEGTNKKKHQDVDTKMVGVTVENIMKFHAMLKEIIIVSGDKDMHPIIECARNNTGASITVVAMRGALAPEIKALVDRTIEL